MLNAASFYSPPALYLSEHMENLKGNFYTSRFWIYELFHRLSPRYRQSTPTRNLKKPLLLTLFDGSVASQRLIFQSTTRDI